MKRNKSILIFVVCFVSITLAAQTKGELKKQKLKLEKEIIYTRQLLSKTKSNKTKSLNYLKTLGAQIINKKQLLQTLNIEISLLNKKAKKTEIYISEVESSIINDSIQIRKLKNEYAKMIYAANKKKGDKNNMIFIVSSSDFNQAYKRILYLKQYSQHRKNQAKKIQESQSQLITKKEELAHQKEKLNQEVVKKEQLLASKNEEFISLNNIKKEKQELLKKLSKSERYFKTEIQKKQTKSKEVDEKIRRIIEEEILKSRKINNNEELTPEGLALSSEFSRNKGRLPWPLEKGVIIGRYGKQKHVVFGDVETFNNGIDIATDKNAEARTVFDGTVSRIFFIKGEGKAVLINHGEYFSVYSGLKEVIVKTGEKLLAKEKIGVVLTHEEEDKTELHFEIWKGYNKQDPSKWIYKAY
ncbi:MAG: hypothetical protein CMD14_04475 [Flavobacteriales bacterium]|nr:hypothetical protein [Flavobacteriales bacterium]|tara:strand:+ start:16978 stop:18216 length:1239 start_codon:yes stop_codon:yes gene_type:complete